MFRCGGKKNFGTLKEAVEILREHLPSSSKVVVRRRAGMKLAGECSKSKGKFYISIDKNLSEDCQVLMLLHEWSHMLSWDSIPDEGEEHGPTWGLAYALVYRIWIVN